MKPANWRRLADKFLEIGRTCKQPMRAFVVLPDQWGIDADKHFCDLFGSATERAAALAEHPVGLSLQWWLNLLRKAGVHYSEISNLGMIDDVCAASAERCYELETEAFEKAPRELLANNARARAEAQAQHEYKVEKLKAEMYQQEALADAAKIVEVPPDEPRLEPPARSGEPTAETIAAQLNRLREECRWTIEQLAENILVSESTVKRHLANKTIPYSRNISAYERVFSKHLNRRIFISKMP